MRTLTTAKTQSLSVVQQSTTRVTLEIGHKPDAQNVGAVVDPTITALTYQIGDYVEDGTPKKFTAQSVFYNDWPDDVKAAIRTLLQWADSDAESRSLVESGNLEIRL